MAVDKLSIATQGYRTASGFNKRAIAVDGYIILVEFIPPEEPGGPVRAEISGQAPVLGGFIKPDDYSDAELEGVYSTQLKELFLAEEELVIAVSTLYLEYESQGLFN